ncbi:hypothetical protein CAter282_3451 [Collimonas arenae]|uniref:Uncharacterized protein n=1 Tax=Collimonas arenae TaxID=279058 RepID=A0A127PTY2_9BURK|nr:hypothetical protein CAter10_3780 [Collimonas arenae]AMP11140.1 hypothetical protein CAter282_3451 [Collimonas arenae]
MFVVSEWRPAVIDNWADVQEELQAGRKAGLGMTNELYR